jgi:hypothetical protein
MASPQTGHIPWAIKSVGMGGGECPTVDRFDGKIEEGVGRHQVQSLSQYIGMGAHLLRGEVWLFCFQIR